MHHLQWKRASAAASKLPASRTSSQPADGGFSAAASGASWAKRHPKYGSHAKLTDEDEAKQRELRRVHELHELGLDPALAHGGDMVPLTLTRKHARTCAVAHCEGVRERVCQNLVDHTHRHTHTHGRARAHTPPRQARAAAAKISEMEAELDGLRRLAAQADDDGYDSSGDAPSAGSAGPRGAGARAADAGTAGAMDISASDEEEDCGVVDEILAHGHQAAHLALGDEARAALERERHRLLAQLASADHGAAASGGGHGPGGERRPESQLPQPVAASTPLIEVCP